MRERNGYSELLGRVVGGYHLDSLFSQNDTSAIFLGQLAGDALPGGDLPSQARIKVFPVPATLPSAAQADVRAQFRREALEALGRAGVQGQPALLASGEDTFAGLLYLVTPAPSSASAAFAEPPPSYEWAAASAGAQLFRPYATAASNTWEGRRGAGARLAMTMLAVTLACGVMGGSALFFSLIRSGIPLPGNGPSYHAGSGCAVPSASVSGSFAPPVGALPDSQQVLRLQSAGATDVQTLDPPDTFDYTSQQYASLVFPRLVALDQNQCVIPWAARSLPTVSSDGQTYTFAIRPGLKWSDGAPITAQTFAFAINRALNPCNSFSAAYYLYDIQDAWNFNNENCDTTTNTISGDIKTLIGDALLTPDSLTLQILLPYPATYFLSELAYPAAAAVPEQLIKQYGNKYIDHLADGAGFGGNLFKVTTWDHKGSLRLTRNDAFWGAKPVLREVDVSFYKDKGAAYNAYLAGKADVGSAPDALVAKIRHHVEFHQIVTQQITYYAMNWRMAPFDNLEMRQAFAVALDKTALAAMTLHGTSLATNHIVPEGLAGYNPSLTGPDGTQSLRGDTALANHLATAYAEKTACGTATDFSKCPQVTLTIESGDQSLLDQANAARRMWLKAMPKYPIIIATMDFNVLLDYVSNGSAQLWDLSWIGDYPDPEDWLSVNLGCNGGYNNGSVCVNAADSLMNDADGNPNQATRLQKYQKAEQILVTDVGWIPLYQAATWWETRSTVHNYTLTTTGLITDDIWQSIYLTAR